MLMNKKFLGSVYPFWGYNASEFHNTYCDDTKKYTNLYGFIHSASFTNQGKQEFNLGLKTKPKNILELPV